MCTDHSLKVYNVDHFILQILLSFLMLIQYKVLLLF